jgi:hypothetical protein
MRAVILLAAVLAATACTGASDPFDRSECPPGEGEFPPTDCALVKGRLLNPQGSPLAGVGVRVDSARFGLGYAYASNGVTTNGNGDFKLVVMRVIRFGPPPSPDTATVAIKLYQQPAPSVGATPFAAVPVRMTFAPLGDPVEPTSAVLTASLP